MRRAIILGLAPLLGLFLLAVASPAWATDDPPEVEIQWLKECLASSDVATLQECVRRFAKLAKAYNDLRAIETDLAASCAASADIEAMRSCLKTMAGRPKPQTADALAAAIRTWDVQTVQSRMDSSKSIVLSLESDDEVQTRMGQRERPRLILRCVENVTAAYVSAGWFLGDAVPVQWRADKDQALAQTWQRSDNRRAAGLWNGARAIPFIKALLGKSLLVMRVTPYQEGPKEMAFHIEGLDKVITPLQQACRWEGITSVR